MPLPGLIKRTNVKTILLPDGYVVVNRDSDNCVYTLTPLAGLLWEFCDGTNEFDRIVSRASQASGLEIDSAKSLTCVKELIEAGLLQIVAA